MRLRQFFSGPLGSAALPALFLLLAAVLPAAPTTTATATAAATPALRLNEILASNTRLALAGTFPDQIELHNAGTTAVDLGGKSLTDDPALPRKFVFPAGTSLPAGGFLVVYADTETTTPGIHTGFALDAEGDVVQLRDSTAGNPVLDEIRFGFQIPDLSISRTGTGANVWALTSPTLGRENAAPTPLGNVAEVRINEWAGKIVFRLDHDLIELFNRSTSPIALGGARLTDNAAQPGKFTFPALSFIPAGGFMPLYGADFVFGLDGDREVITLFGENPEQIDQVTVLNQVADQSGGRTPDGGAAFATFRIPTPGLPNTTALPAPYADLLAYLRITEVMYGPSAPSNASQFEFIELQNIGPVPLNLSGVRITNGVSHEFPAGTTLAPGAFLVVVNDRSSFRSRYPQVPDSTIAAGGFNGSLANEGETLALTLPSPWRVHILRFRYEPTWYPSTAGGGYSLVPVAPATAAPQDWQQRAAWRPSAAVNGSPGAADPGTATGSTITSRLSNLSVRASLATAQNLIVGFVVDGGPRNILVRAAGPGLGALGVGGTMSDPRLDLYTTGTTPLLSNDNWDASLAGVFQSVGAFAFPAASRDAAFQQALNGGASVHARGTGAGIVLVEAYDTGSGNSPRMVNLSARNFVGTGDEILIAGFALAGTGQKRLLVRASGPALAALGVTGTLADPRLELFRGTTSLAQNDNWDASLAATFSSVGAFAFPAASRDSALIVTLDAGATYTVQVSGVGATTGEALIEIYELP